MPARCLQPCGGAIPLCMIGEFDLPEEIVDRKVTKMKMISPSNHEVDVGRTLSEKEYIGMCRREVLDDFLRKRASSAGANLINGLFMRLEQVRGQAGRSLTRRLCWAHDPDAAGPQLCLPGLLSVPLLAGHRRAEASAPGAPRALLRHALQCSSQSAAAGQRKLAGAGLDARSLLCTRPARGHSSLALKPPLAGAERG